MTLHVVQYSGGIGSWAAAMRVAERHGTDNLVLLTADAKAEDADLWRFVDDSARLLGVEPVIVADGRDPWQVFRDVRWLGNSRLAPCSHALKQAPCRAWLNEHADPTDTVLYVGYDHTELRRIPATRKGWQPWHVEFPMAEPPHLTKDDMFAWSRSLGLTPPRLYAWAEHNNCAGKCVRAGKKHWAKLWANDPAGFADAERAEHEIRAFLNKPVTILREQVNGQQRSLTLTELRHRLEADAASPRQPLSW